MVNPTDIYTFIRRLGAGTYGQVRFNKNAIMMPWTVFIACKYKITPKCTYI